MRPSGWLMWGALALAIGVSMYLVKYKVQALEDQLIAKRDLITRNRGAIRVLEAEWTYLNDPGRLRRLSAQYLGLGPAIPQNMMDVTALPMRAPVEAPAVQAPGADGTPMPADKAQSGTKTVPALGPVERADNGQVFTNDRPAPFPVLVARLQRLLFPDAIGATVLQENKR